MASKRAFPVEENKQIARRFPEQVVTQGNLDLIDEICAEDMIDHSPMWEVRGREAVKEQSRALFEAIGDFSATVEDIVAEGDRIAMRVTVRGVHEGEIMGLEPTGRSFEIGNNVFMRIVDGRIVERWVALDMLGLLRQLGVDEIPGAPPQ